MHKAARPDSLGMDNAGGGLAVNQLLKMKARGVITLEQFLELTKDIPGFVEDVPVELDADAAGGGEAAEKDEEEDGGEEDSEEGEDEDEDEDEAVDEDGEDGGEEEDTGIEEEEQEAAPSAKKQANGSMLAFVTKHAPPPAKIASERKVPVSKYQPKKPVNVQPNSHAGGG
eukprot:840218-Prymnesium_polylepis.1